MEALLDFDEEAKGNASTERGIGNYEVGETASGEGGGGVFGRSIGNVVDEVVVVGVG